MLAFITKWVCNAGVNKGLGDKPVAIQWETYIECTLMDELMSLFGSWKKTTGCDPEDASGFFRES
jgi:hypothetical protein